MSEDRPTPRQLLPLAAKIGRERVQQVIHDFYARLLADAGLRPYFARLPDLAHHEAVIVDFWWIAMGGRSEAPPTVDMLGRHRALNIDTTHLRRWLLLFRETLDAHLPPDLAGQWYQMAVAVGERLHGMGGISG